VNEPPLLAIVGPTASGKTAAALALAERLGGEIINGDPQQFYRGMDVGTAKPSAEERTRVAHHLLDIAEPGERVSLRAFQQMAGEAIEEIGSREALPIFVSGSGQYVWGLLEGWTVPQVPPDERLRSELEQRAHRDGAESLHRQLAQVDAEAAARIHPNNTRRVVRALEVYLRTGQPISSCQARNPLTNPTCVVGLEVEASELDARIARRTAQMLGAGLIDEAAALLERNGRDALTAIGYREAVAHLEGELTIDETEALIARNTRRLARRQMAWFKRDDARIHWLRSSDIVGMAELAARELDRAVLAPRL
jgi:tRNA dimethylallyltransferase